MFGAYAILFNSVQELCVTMMYPDLSEDNKKYANEYLTYVMDIIENIPETKNLSLNEFIGN